MEKVMVIWDLEAEKRKVKGQKKEGKRVLSRLLWTRVLIGSKM
jgi:hypothetical protein